MGTSSTMGMVNYVVLPESTNLKMQESTIGPLLTEAPSYALD